MTRDEAYKKLQESQNGKKIEAGDIPFNQFCAYAEALGFIKFDEVKSDVRLSRL